MTHIEYVACDECGKRLENGVPFSLTRMISKPGILPNLGTITTDACSTACLVRLAADLHRQPKAPSDELEAMS